MKHNFLRRVGALLLALALALPMAVTTAWAEDGDTVAVTGVTLSASLLELEPGETHVLTAEVQPENATDKSVQWDTSNEKVATVDNGLITAVAPGEAVISVASSVSPTRRAYCNVKVSDPTIPTISLSVKELPLLVGNTWTLTYTAEPGTDKEPTVTWRSSNSSAVSVRDGVVTAVRQGTATITVTLTNSLGKTATDTCTVTVSSPGGLDATALSAKGSTTLTLSAGEQTPVAVNVTPSTAYVTWSSDRPSVADVFSSGTGGMVIQAFSPGTAIITAMARKSDGTELTVEYTVTVMGRAIGIEFDDRNSNILTDSSTGSLYAQFDASSARTKTVPVNVTSDGSGLTNTYIVWSSGDTSIVTVSTAASTTSGVLTVSTTRPAGRTTVTATVYDSTTRQPVLQADGKTPLSATLDVVVSGIILSASSLTMYEGEAKSLTIANSYGEAEGTDAGSVQWTSSDPSVATMEGGSLNAWSKGTTTITATTRDGSYTARCAVTVTEDPGTVVSAGSAAAGNSIQLGTASVRSQMNSVAQQRVGSTMSYITGIFISPTQGVVYNSYTSEADTGAGVSMQEKYNVAGTGPTTIEALSFVPNKSYSGEARISYTGYTADGQSIAGVITVSVTGMGDAGSDVTYTSIAAPVTFQAEDFNLICSSKTGRTLKYVTFTPPQATVGTLYENYINDAHPGQKVVSTTQYNRTGSPNLSSVTFVPADGYSGTARISYRAVDSSNATYTGTVTITVSKAASTSDPADIYYTAPLDGWATFRAADFANASLRTIGETLSHVRFSLPASSEGTLFYNYRGFGNYDSAVISTTSYYQAGTPSLGLVTFVPATTFSGQVTITYTGYSTRGTTFSGRVFVGQGPSTSTSQPGTNPGVYYNYTVSSGSSVSLSAADFNSACVAATGATLNYIRFTSLPSSTQGALRYRTGSSTSYSNVTTSTQLYRTSTNTYTPQIGNVSFLASTSYTGVVRLPYIGYNTNGSSFTGEVTIQVTPNTIVYTGTTASPIPLSASRIRSAVSATFSRELSYIEFTSLPDASAGRLYLNYAGYGTGSQVVTGARYYASTSPTIDQLSFVPKGRYTGDATASYTAYSTSGERMTGQITFRISAATRSSYFSDMGNYGWAAASVDYLYQNKVVNGITPTTFGPSQQILRRDFVLMLYRAFRFTGGSATNTGFADVPANAYYAQAVSAAKQLGIASGDGTNFMPASQVTRQDAMVMIKNAMVAAGKLKGTASTTVLNNFTDGSAVSSYAREAVSILVQMGAVTGDNGRLNPLTPITRAEAAVILHFVMTA